MGLSISAAGLSFQPSNNDVGAVRNKLNDIKNALPKSTLGPVLEKEVASITTDLKAFIELKSPKVKDYGEIMRKVAEFMDHIAEIDESFIQDQLEMSNTDRKREKGKIVSEFLKDQVAGINPGLVSMAGSRAMSGVSGASSSSSGFAMGTDTSGPDWVLDQEGMDNLELGDVLTNAQANQEGRPVWSGQGPHPSFPPFTQDDAAAAGINLDKAKKGDLGEMAALAALTRSVSGGGASKDGVQYHYSASTAAASSLLQAVKGFSPDQLKEMVKVILKRGIKDLGDVTDLMKILGELGLQAPGDLLMDIQDALTDFVEDMANNATDLTDFLTFMKSIQGLTSEFGGNIFDSSLGDSLSSLEATSGNQSAALELQGMGINVQLMDSSDSKLDDPLAEVEKAMQGQKGVTFQSGSNVLAEAQAGGMSGINSPAIPGDMSIENTSLKVGGIDPLRRVESKSLSSQVDLQTDEKKALEGIGSKLLDIADKGKVEFANNVVDFVQKFMDKQLAAHLGQLL